MGEAAGTVLKFLLDYTYDYLQYNYDLISGADENVGKMLKDIEELRSFVKHFIKESHDNEYIEKLANVVLDVIYQAEDTAEKYFIYSYRQNQKTQAKQLIHYIKNYAGELRKVGEECVKVREKIQMLFQNELPNAINAIAAAGQITKNSNRSPVKEDKIIGFIDAADDVKKYLSSGCAELQAYSIVGLLGLGKTTLARKVYDDPIITYRFFARAFVTVSEVYEKKDVLLKILNHFEPITGDISKMSQETIRDRIHVHLNGKQYLIVLDDVWDIKAWDDLIEAFPRNQKHSRILITSRYSKVARHANPSVEPYRLRSMHDNERKDLLRLKVFGEAGCPEDLESHIADYEVLILHKSGGLPLAIVVIAGILLDKKFIPEWWKKVYDRVINYDHANEERSIELIRLSYTSLPYYLKPCFLYLGVFPEDFNIPVWKLVRLWIAEGFIQGNGNLEDIAERYLEDLVDRNLVMVAKSRLNGLIKSCRVHDFLREFLKTEAKSQNLFQDFKGSSPVRTTDRSPDDYLRIAVNSQVLEYVASGHKGNRVRSFLSFREEGKEMPKTNTIFKSFQLLRVFDIRAVQFQSFPPEIFNLILLKYLAISSDSETVSDKLSKLFNLETVIIEAKSRKLTIKADISLMVKLRHLHTNTSTSLQEDKGGASSTPSKSNVQTLSSIAPESCTRKFFERFKELKKLGIQGNLAACVHPEEGPGLFDNLSTLESLENLKLLNDNVDAKLYSLPSENNFPSTLSRLTLCKTFLDWKHMSTLGKLKNLKVLKLKDNAFGGTAKIWEVKDEGFAGLMVLHIGKTDLVLWKASAAQFPRLTTLILKHCEELISIPRDFANIASLQMIDLHWTSRVVSSAKNIKLLKLEMQQQNDQIPQNQQPYREFKLGIYPPEDQND